jgi:prepilin-type N-terminal cleavage/methylation domain-containing protein
MFQKNKKGFTLIELMVVIAIIAILATVVLVALQGARDAAEDSKRQSAVTQVRSIAEIHYATNNQVYTGFNTSQNADWVHISTEMPAIVASVTDEAYCVYMALTGDDAFCLSNTEGPGKYPASEITCGTGTNSYICRP